MKLHTVTTPACEGLHEPIGQLPQLMDQGEGTLLHAGRNEVRLLTVGGRQVVVKRFRTYGLLRAVAGLVRQRNKARRSYLNALEIMRRGACTPAPVAYMEWRRWRLARRVYYVSAYTACRPICERLVDRVPYDRALAEAFGRYVASLHAAGIVHRDLNNTNVLYEPLAGGGYRFELIDVNRVTFYPAGRVPRRVRMQNLTLFSHLDTMFATVLHSYADACGWTAADVSEALSVKRRHDRHWDRKQAWKRRLGLKKNH